MSEKTARAGWWIALLFVISTEAAGAVPVRLIDAVKAADRDAIRTLLQQRVDVNAAEADGTTALHWAARANDLQAADMLLRAGANVKLANRYGVTPLYLASTNGNAAMIELLLKAGADPNSVLPAGETALMTAARSGNADAVTTLIGRGADVNRKEAWRGQNAFMLAVGNAHYELANFLLDKGADPNFAPLGFTALHQITWLRRPGSGDNNPAPQGSGNMDSLEFVRKLVAHGANVNARATKQARINVTVQFRTTGATPFLLACRTADIPLMRLLLELGAAPLQPNDYGTTPLLAAAGVGTNSAEEEPGTEAEILEAVKLVLAHGGNVNDVDKNGNTAMHGAAHKRAPSLIRLLAEKGAKIEIWNQPNNAKQTPLQVAEGVRVGLNIRSHAPSAEAIREVMASAAKKE